MTTLPTTPWLRPPRLPRLRVILPQRYGKDGRLERKRAALSPLCYTLPYEGRRISLEAKSKSEIFAAATFGTRLMDNRRLIRLR